MFKRLGLLAILCAPLLIAAAHAADFDPKAATDAYLATIAGDARAKSDAYFEGGYWLILYNAAANIGIALLLLFTRVASGLRSFVERFFPWNWLQTFVLGMLFIAVNQAISFPLDHYQGFTREHEFGLSNQTFDQWFSDYLKGTAVAMIGGGLFVTALYAVIRRAPQTWWIYGAGTVATFAILGALVAPVLISPLFNTYKPMRDGELKQQILSLARANGIPVTDVYEVDASRQSKRVSANVQGLGSSARISLNDNLLNRSTPAEVRAVMAHEMGHYVLGHVYKSIAYITLLSIVAFALANLGFGVLHRGFGRIWGVRDITDPAGYLILSVLFTVIGFLGTPITNTMVRTHEAEADIFGLNAAREPDGFATTALKLSEYRKLDPTPWEEFIFFDHPSGRSRITMAMNWKAEHLSELPAAAPETAPASAPAAPAPAENPPSDKPPAP